MMKQLGYDAILLSAVVFGSLTAAISISEEIEGRTAITVISKPVSRRQFMLGKYAGIVLAGLFMFGLLAVYFQGMLLLKHWWEKLEPYNQTQTYESATSAEAWIGVAPIPAWVNEWADRLTTSDQVRPVLRGLGHWGVHALDTLPGLVLCFSQVMVLVGLAVALATRVPMVVNVLSVIFVYGAAHLTPVLLAVSNRARMPKLIGFVARVLDTVLPDLGMFRIDPAVLSEAPPPAYPFATYVGSVTLYGLIYTGIVLLFGLILFEDRDLA
jgi:ABC-type Na+ efflux pump permease subunit